MILPQDLIIALAIVVGLIGCIIQIIPGGLVVGGAILVWAILTGGTAAWVVFSLAIVVILSGSILKYAIAGKHLKRASVSSISIVVGLIVGVIGFFIIPVLGLPIGFIAGVFVCEYLREGRLDPAWKSTVVALKATGLTILVELCASLVAATAWIVGLMLT